MKLITLNPVQFYDISKYCMFVYLLLAFITYLVQIKAFVTYLVQINFCMINMTGSKLSIFSHPGKIIGYWITTRSFPYRGPYWPGRIWASTSSQANMGVSFQNVGSM